MGNIQPFTALTLTANGRVNRLISEVDISAPTQAGSPSPRHNTSALWDTGATASVISSSVAIALGLVPVGAYQVQHAGGSSLHNAHVVNFYLLPNEVCVQGVLVTETPNSNDFGAIIGMDIITLGDFRITNENGLTCMSFRVPSIKTIDYVKEINRLTFHKVGRNEPCPCGAVDAAGKRIKYKSCHSGKI